MRLAIPFLICSEQTCTNIENQQINSAQFWLLRAYVFAFVWPHLRVNMLLSLH